MIRRQSCPICAKSLPADAGVSLTTFPFCSDRCRQIDFFRWSDGKYAIVEELDPAVAELFQELDNEGSVDESTN